MKEWFDRMQNEHPVATGWVLGLTFSAVLIAFLSGLSSYQPRDAEGPLYQRTIHDPQASAPGPHRPGQ